MLLKDKVALITGAGSGIGQGVAERFAREGARLALVDLNEAGLAETAAKVKAAGAEAECYGADVSVTADVEDFFAKAIARFGRLDVCVNNAGIGNPPMPLVQMTDEGFDRTIAVNLRGVLCMRAAGRQMIAQGGGGRIISVASQAVKSGFAFLAPYCATKAGVILMTKAMVQRGRPSDAELDRRSIRPAPPLVRKGVAPLRSGSLGEIVRMFKSLSTKRINGLRGAPARQVWQRNYYERVVRDDDELQRVRQYILDNPAKWAEDPKQPGDH